MKNLRLSDNRLTLAFSVTILLISGCRETTPKVTTDTHLSGSLHRPFESGEYATVLTALRSGSRDLQAEQGSGSDDWDTRIHEQAFSIVQKDKLKWANLFDQAKLDRGERSVLITFLLYGKTDNSARFSENIGVAMRLATSSIPEEVRSATSYLRKWSIESPGMIKEHSELVPLARSIIDSAAGSERAANMALVLRAFPSAVNIKYMREALAGLPAESSLRRELEGAIRGAQDKIDRSHVSPQ